MKNVKIGTLLLSLLLCSAFVGASEKEKQPVDTDALDRCFYIRSFSILLPPKSQADDFIDFIRTDLIPAGFNSLVLRINWSYNFQSRPELADPQGWPMGKIKELVSLCRDNGVEIVPLMNLLGHQSWQGRVGKLLEVYPQFDEKPQVALPTGEYKWPNPDRLYCKSYCPNHPEVHKVVFECVDEVMDAFEAKNFHAGMDEVFDIADIDCSRCGGLDPAEVFAKEINKIAAHLAADGRRLWIWGDRLLDGRTDASGYGEWSASIGNTHRAIDMIDKSVMICDWHYRNAEQSAVLFAIKGFDVITCGWEQPEITALQLQDMVRFREHSSKYMSARFKGFMQTVWSSYGQFMDEYRNETDKPRSAAKSYIYLKGAFGEYARKYQNASAKKEQQSTFGQ